MPNVLFCFYLILIGQLCHAFPDIKVVHGNADLGKWNRRYFHVSHLTPQTRSLLLHAKCPSGLQFSLVGRSQTPLHSTSRSQKFAASTVELGDWNPDRPIDTLLHKVQLYNLLSFWNQECEGGCSLTPCPWWNSEQPKPVLPSSLINGTFSPIQWNI